MRYEEIAKRSVSEANNAMRTLRAVSRRAAGCCRIGGRSARDENHSHGLPARGVADAGAPNDVLEPHEMGPWLKGVEGLQSDRSRRALLTLLLTGLRAQEALSSTGATSRRTGAAIIADSKTGGFTKLIGPRLVEWLAMAGRRGKGALFGVNDLRAALEQVEKAGGKAITPHDLRRTFASFAERAGAPMTTLKVLMNHSTRGDITMGYVRPSEGDFLHWAADRERDPRRAEGGESCRLIVHEARRGLRAVGGVRDD